MLIMIKDIPGPTQEAHHETVTSTFSLLNKAPSTDPLTQILAMLPDLVLILPSMTVFLFPMTHSIPSRV